MKTAYTHYQPRFVSPIQPKPHPVKEMRRKALDTSDTEHPVRRALRNLCANPIKLSVSFSEDTTAHSTLKIPGLLAIKCVVSDEGKPLGIGYSSGYLSRINRQHERTLFSILNGSLLSAMNAVCKSLDALRLEKSDEEASTNRMLGEAYQARDMATASTPASDRQKQYLRSLASSEMEEGAAENFLASIEDMTREEASSAIQQFSK